MNSNVRHDYALGGLHFALNSPDYADSADLALFRTEPEDAAVIWTVELKERLQQPQGKCLHKDPFNEILETSDGRVKLEYDERDRELLYSEEMEGPARKILCRTKCLEYFGPHLALGLMDIPHLMPHLGGVFLHASYVDAGGEALLFTGPKQVGKSTQAALWCKYRGAEVINGDRALLRASEGHFRAYGSPYCGTSGICLKRDLPVKAVVILSKAPENRAAHVGVRQALAAMLDGCSFDTWDAEAVGHVMDISRELIGEVPFYSLACVPDESAVEALEEIWQKEKEK